MFFPCPLNKNRKEKIKGNNIDLAIKAQNAIL